MLTEGEVRVLIVKRLMAACDSSSSYHINHVEGQIRGLLAVLNDGKKFDSDGNCRAILDAAGIPWTPHPKDEKGWAIPDEWFAQHGATVTGSSVDHPKLKDW